MLLQNLMGIQINKHNSLPDCRQRSVEMEKGYLGDGPSAPYPGPPMNYGGIATGQGPQPGLYPQPPGGYPASPGPPQPGFQPGPYQGGECLLVHIVLQKAGITAYCACENQAFSQMSFCNKKYLQLRMFVFIYFFLLHNQLHLRDDRTHNKHY